jgi:hypothetical protein
MPPRSKRAPGQRPRAPKADADQARIVGLTLDVEEPLNDAADFVRALRLIGTGMMLDDEDEGRAITATAWAATARLDALRAAWLRLLKAARRCRRMS